MNGNQLHTILTNSPAECQYSTYDRELLAVYLAIKHFRHYVEGRVFTVYTDDKPLTYSMNISPRGVVNGRYLLHWI